MLSSGRRLSAASAPIQSPARRQSLCGPRDASRQEAGIKRRPAGKLARWLAEPLGRLSGWLSENCAPAGLAEEPHERQSVTREKRAREKGQSLAASSPKTSLPKTSLPKTSWPTFALFSAPIQPDWRPQKGRHTLAHLAGQKWAKSGRKVTDRQEMGPKIGASEQGRKWAPPAETGPRLSPPSRQDIRLMERARPSALCARLPSARLPEQRAPFSLSLGRS